MVVAEQEKILSFLPKKGVGLYYEPLGRRGSVLLLQIPAVSLTYNLTDRFPFLR